MLTMRQKIDENFTKFHQLAPNSILNGKKTIPKNQDQKVSDIVTTAIGTENDRSTNLETLAQTINEELDLGHNRPNYLSLSNLYQWSAKIFNTFIPSRELAADHTLRHKRPILAKTVSNIFDLLTTLTAASKNLKRTNTAVNGFLNMRAICIEPILKEFSLQELHQKIITSPSPLINRA